MKILLVTIFIFYTYSQISAQKENIPMQEITQSVKDFFELVNLYAEKYKNNYESAKALTREEIKIWAKKYYKAKAEDPVGFNNYIHIETEKLRNKLSKNKDSAHETRPGVKVGIIKRIIALHYGDQFAEAIDVPYFLKAKVLDITQGKFEGNIEKIIMPKTILKIEVQEIIKGKGQFKENDTLEVNFLSDWMRGSSKTFTIGQIYFLPIRPWNCYEGICRELALNQFPDNNFGIYPIENNFIKIDNDYFLLGKKVEWNAFKKEFINRYLF